MLWISITESFRRRENASINPSSTIWPPLDDTEFLLTLFCSHCQTFYLDIHSINLDFIKKSASFVPIYDIHTTK